MRFLRRFSRKQIAVVVAATLVVGGGLGIAAATSGAGPARVSARVDHEPSPSVPDSTNTTRASSRWLSSSTTASTASATREPSAFPPSAPGSSYSTVPAAPTNDADPTGSDSTTTSTTTPFVQGPTTFVVAPDRNLPERAWTTISGSGLRPNARAFVIECLVTAPADAERTATGCDTGPWWNSDEGEFFTDDRGDFRGVRPVRRVLFDGSDCARFQCELRVSSGWEPTIVARTPLSFSGPPGSSRPAVLHIDPATDLVDGEVVRVTAENVMPGPGSIHECVDPNCEYPGRSVTFASDGTLDITFVVHRHFQAVTRHDCVVEHCSLSIGPIAESLAPISFAAVS